MPSYIVTGGAGFIGSNVVRALNARGVKDIVIVDHKNHPAKESNLASLEFSQFLDKGVFRQMIREQSISPAELVIHLGACSSTLETNEQYLADNNIAYSKELCQWALANKSRFIYASSAATYGDGSLGYKDDEQLSFDLKPLNPYGWSKLKFDQWLAQEGLFSQVVGIKYFNIYGPGEEHKGEMRSLIRKAYDVVLSKGVIRLFASLRDEIADGEQTRDFISVQDAVRETLYFADQPSIAGLYNCGTGKARSWNSLAYALFAALGREPLIEYVSMPEQYRERYQYHTQADLTRLRSVGFSHEFESIESGVAMYVRQLQTRSL